MSRFRTVRWRVTLAATAVVALALGAASVGIVRLVEVALVRATEDTLADALRSRAARVAGGGAGGAAQPVSTETFYAFSTDDGEYRLGVFVERDEGAAFGELLEEDEVVALLEVDVTTGEILEVLEPETEEPLPPAEVPFEVEGLLVDALSIEGDQVLVAASALDEVRASVRAVERALAVTVPAVVLALGGVSWLLAGRALRPVQSITRRVREISAARLDQRVPVPGGGDEITDLAVTMNDMLDRVEAGGVRQRQFSADASHELRSPLSVVRAAADRLVLETSDESARELAREVQLASDRMAQLIGDLLTLAEVEDAGEEPELGPVDLGAVAEAVRPRDDPRVSVRVSGAVRVRGAPRQLERAVGNLVDNARRHARSRVVVEVSAADGTAELVVADDGPGVPPELAARAFDRFTRLDAGRARRDGGAGLGLAIVKAVVERHRGTVELGASARLGGAAAVVRLPLDATVP